ncbi:MAG: TetR/AcrR family transcriptional regulator [Solirubrobacteraceae bacterium]
MDGAATPEPTRTTGAPRRRAPRRPPHERREEVLDAAMRLIVRDGYRAATMTAVARELHLTKPVIYAVFPNFKELGEALIEREQLRCLAQIRDALTAAVQPDLEPSAIMPAALGAFLRSVAERPEPWRLVLMPGGALPGELARRVRDGRRWAVDGFTRLCEQTLVSTRADGTAVDLEALVEGMIAAAERYAQLLLADPERWTPERLERFAATDLAWPRGSGAIRLGGPGSAPAGGATSPTRGLYAPPS